MRKNRGAKNNPRRKRRGAERDGSDVNSSEEEGDQDHRLSREELKRQVNLNPEEFVDPSVRKKKARLKDPHENVCKATVEDPGALAKMEQIEENVAFCCKTCRCPPERKQAVPLGDSNDAFIQAGEGTVSHRRCCHHCFQPIVEGQAWLSSADEAIALCAQLCDENPRKQEFIENVALEDLTAILTEIQNQGTASRYLPPLKQVLKKLKNGRVEKVQLKIKNIKEKLDTIYNEEQREKEQNNLSELEEELEELTVRSIGELKELIADIKNLDATRIQQKINKLKQKLVELDYDKKHNPIKRFPYDDGTDMCVYAWGESDSAKQSRYYNEDSFEDTIGLAMTDPKYLDVLKAFEALEESGKRGPITVVALFDGIGILLAVLKGLGIAVKKVISVEYDKVARGVYKYNHDCDFNRRFDREIEDDGIEHVYDYVTFEEFEKDLDAVIKAHGPIDLVVAGPPCQDYTAVNAHREGAKGLMGQYLPRTGIVIKKLQELQKNHKMFYLVENAPLRDDIKKAMDKTDLHIAKESLGMEHQPYLVGSHAHAPCHRERHYFSNIPLLVDLTVQSGEVPETQECLDPEWHMAGNVVHGDMLCKGPTFMASKLRLDDERRMLVFKKPVEGWCEARAWKPVEREKAMGFPKGYVEEAVDFLFATIQQGYMQQFLNDPWTKDHKLLELCKEGYSGNFHKIPAPEGQLAEGKPGLTVTFSVENRSMIPHIEMAPPQVTKKPSYYNASDYTKRLIGNSFCAFTLSRLLSPLKEVFETKSYHSRFSMYCFQGSTSQQKQDSTEHYPSVEDEVIRLQAELKEKFGERPENEIACSTGCGKVETRKGRVKFTCAECLARKENGQKKAAAPHETTSSNGRYQQTASPTGSSVSSSSPSLENEIGIASNEANKPIAEPSVVRSQCHTEEI